MSKYAWLRNVSGSQGRTVKVGIKSFAHLRRILGKSAVIIERPEGTTVADLIDFLAVEYGHAASQAIWGQTVLTQPGPGSKIIAPLHDGKAIPADTKLLDGMTIVFMPILAGA